MATSAVPNINTPLLPRNNTTPSLSESICGCLQGVGSLTGGFSIFIVANCAWSMICDPSTANPMVLTFTAISTISNIWGVVQMVRRPPHSNVDANVVYHQTMVNVYQRLGGSDQNIIKNSNLDQVTAAVETLVNRLRNPGENL